MDHMCIFIRVFFFLGDIFCLFVDNENLIICTKEKYFRLEKNSELIRGSANSKMENFSV